jgi:hypothetical protein
LPFRTSTAEIDRKAEGDPRNEILRLPLSSREILKMKTRPKKKKKLNFLEKKKKLILNQKWNRGWVK